MSKAAAEQTLKRMEKFLNSDQARAAVDAQAQRVWMYYDDVAASFKDGYNLVHKRRKKEGTQLPKLSNKFFDSVAKAAIAAVVKHLERPRTRSSLVVQTNRYITFDQPRFIATPFNTLKKVAREKINAKLKSEGFDELTKYRSERGKEGSESALLAQGTQRLHRTKRSVGALQLLAANEWASRSPTYQKFTEIAEVKSLVEKFGQIELSFKKGSYEGKNKVKFNPNMRVAIEVGAHSDNPAGDLSTDWKTIKPKLQKLLEKFVVNEGIADVKGSNSIRQDARQHARHTVISELRKKARVVSDSTPVKRQKQTTEVKKKKPAGKKRKGYRSRVGYQEAKASTQKEGASLYTILALINSKLPETVRKNMGPPRLESQTGRFAESVKMTDVVQTPQGFPSFGYTYRKDPYQVYESSSGSRFADPDRDPRELIDASIREIAIGYALGRFYTRRV